ncbi:MAG TPA: glycosyltransferase [Acidisarcina sp.]
MKILQVVASTSPSAGGPIEGVLQTSRWSTAAGNSVELLTLDDPAAPEIATCALRVNAVGPVSSTFGYTKSLLRWLRQNAASYDVVVVNGLWQYLTYAVWKALKTTGTPYVVFPHGMLDPYFKQASPIKHLKKAIYWSLIERKVLQDAAAVAFTCEEERALARQTFPGFSVREAVVGYGTSMPEVDLAGAGKAFLDAYPRLTGKRLVLFISRIHPKKGCDLLLKAFAARLAADPAWYLVMAGPDQVGWQAELAKLSTTLGIEDRVVWTGMLRDTLKWGAFATAEVFALPSHQENFGIAVVEALACGLPVLISHKVNIWQEIMACGAGLCAADTVEGASSMLNEWSEINASQRETMRAAAQLCFERHFEARATSAALDALLLKCVGEKRSGPAQKAPRSHQTV